MEKIRNLSIRKTILLYMTVSLIISFFTAAFIEMSASDFQERIWWKYTDQESYNEADQKEHSAYQITVPRISNSEMSPLDVNLSEACDFLQTWAVLITSFCGSIIAVFLFYRNKIKPPLKELQESSRRIAANELDFSITYNSQDELGKLCAQFEKMRKQLEENNRAMWKLVEQEKELRAAISHDIRSPLTVLKGYQEMLLEFLPQGTLDQETAVEMLLSGMGQIERLQDFIDTMRQLSALEDRQVQYQETELAPYAQQLKDSAQLLAGRVGKLCILNADTRQHKLWFDARLVTEVFENLLSNALRYAEKKITIDITVEDTCLCVSVSDDGAGFSQDTAEVTKAYYHANPQDDLQHFGLGLYICRIYCEKHGGRLLIGSSPGRGARVKAVFRCRGEGE